MLNLLTENLLSQWTRNDPTMLTAVIVRTITYVKGMNCSPYTAVILKQRTRFFNKLYYNIYFLNEKFTVIQIFFESL